MNELLLDVKGMSCGHCVSMAKRALEQVEGVERAEVTLNPGSAKVWHQGASLEALIGALQSEDFVATVRIQ